MKTGTRFPGRRRRSTDNPAVWRSQIVPEFEYIRIQLGVSKASSYLPAGFQTLTVHLTVNGATQYIEFLNRAFDAVELTRSTSQDGRLLNASVRVANSVMMLNDVFPEFGGEAYRSGRAVRLTVYVPDADAAWAKAVAAGCKVISPVLGRPLWRSGGPVRVRLGDPNAPGGSDRARNRGSAKEGVRRKPAVSSILRTARCFDSHISSRKQPISARATRSRDVGLWNDY